MIFYTGLNILCIINLNFNPELKNRKTKFRSCKIMRTAAGSKVK